MTASIREVADAFDLPISTLHFWERKGLVRSHRRSGCRRYDADQIYRIALVRLWRETGRMTLDEISAILDGRAAPGWRDTVTTRIRAIESQLEQLDTARSYLRHLLDCPRDDALEECPGFRSTVVLPPGVRDDGP